MSECRVEDDNNSIIIRFAAEMLGPDIFRPRSRISPSGSRAAALVTTLMTPQAEELGGSSQEGRRIDVDLNTAACNRDVGFSGVL